MLVAIFKPISYVVNTKNTDQEGELHKTLSKSMLFY
jgi:hypothetical protein